MKKILVIGASGFVGGHLTKQLVVDGYKVRCLARIPDKIRDLEKSGCEVVQGDISDMQSLRNATQSIDAVYISIQTIVAQPGNKGSKDFMDVEMAGIQNIISACKENNVSRIIYVTFLGVTPHSKSSWSTGRWKTEQLLIHSGLQATIIRPGMIIGAAGMGYNAIVTNAKKNTAYVMGSGKQRFRPIAVSDLVYYLEGVIHVPITFGQAYDVGGDEIYNTEQMIDLVADILNRPHPKKRHIPMGVMGALSFILEPMMKMQKGSLKSYVDGMGSDLIGDDHTAIKKILPRQLLTFKEASIKALGL